MKYIVAFFAGSAIYCMGWWGHEISREHVPPVVHHRDGQEPLSDDDLTTATHAVLFVHLEGCGVLVNVKTAPDCLKSISRLRAWTSTLPKGRVRDRYDEWLGWFEKKSNDQLRIPRAVAALPKPPQ